MAKAITPDFAVGAHASALGISFGADTKLPARFRDGFHVAELGFGTFVPFRNGKAVGPMQPVLTGFTDGPGHVHGRPRALATARDGSVLIVDDKGGTIWRIAAASPAK